MKKYLFAVCIAVLPCLAFAKQDTPDWVNGSSMEFPREQYVTGVGLGDDRTTAEERARAQVAQVFSALVTVDTTLSESESNATDNSASKTSFMQNIKQNIQTTSSKILEGVEIADNWQDPATKQYYALAVLERAPAIKAMNGRIADINTEAAVWKKDFDAAQEKFARVKAAVKMLALIKMKDDLKSQLRVLDPSGANIVDTQDLSMKPELLKAVSALDIAVNVTGEKASDVETGIVTALTALNMEAKIVSGQEPSEYASSDIVVDAAVTVEQPKNTLKDDRWQWSRATVTVSMKDGKSGKVFMQFSVTDRQASAAYEEAVRRSLASVARKVSLQISGAVTSYFENQ